MTDNLVMAEECIDRLAKTEVFEGRNIEWVTGRVLLHALNDDGHSLCGQPSNLLTPTERQWSAACLPHLPRCQGCMTARPGAAPGDCSAGGDYGRSADHEQAFVVTESRGRWGKAIEVPGSARLNVGGQAEVESVSCAAPGHCSAAGFYSSGSAGLDSGVFVVTES